MIVILISSFFLSPQQNRSEWQIVFIIAAVIFFVGNLIFVLFGSAETQPWDDPDFLRKDNVEETIKIDRPKSVFKEIFGADDKVLEHIEGWPVEKRGNEKSNEEENEAAKRY